MKTFNLIKSFTTLVNNITSLPFREGLGVGLGKVRMGLRMLVLCLSLATFGVNEVWGGSDTYYGKFSVAVSTNSTGKGTVYAADKNNATSGNSSVSISTSTKSGSVNAYAFATPNAGYHLQGWSKTNGNSDLGTNNPYTMSGKASGTKDGTNDNGTWYATFAANTNTKYIVKHYQQNVDGSYPANATETDNLTGTTDTKVTPARKSYTGFTAPDGKELTIMGDGSASVSYNYTRNSYTLTWDLAGGSVTTAGTAAGQVKYGATLTSPEVSKQGALFNGWSPEVPATMPAANVTYTAQWVSKYNIEVTGSNQNMKVGNTQDNAFTFVHAENPVPHISVVSLDPINNGDGQVIEYDAANNKIIAHNAGTATIYFTQAGTETMYESTSASFTYTITKYDNHISINGSQDSYATSCFMDGYATINLTATNTDYAGSPFNNVQTAGNDIATFYQNDNVVYASNKLGAATWTISQPENYKYKAANATLTINVVKQAEATDCYVLNDNSEHSFSTGITDFEGHFDTPLAINGPAYQLKFDAKKNGVNKFVAQYSTDGGGSWTDIVNEPNLSDSYQTFGPYNVPDNATHIRFGAKTGGTLKKWYKNVRVTRKTYLNASDFTINTQNDNATLVYPGTKGTGSFRVDYSLANGGDLKIVCDNPKFTIDKTTQTNVDCQTGSFDANMTYTSQTAGTDYAHVVIYNNVYRKEITVTGITQKHQQDLKWKANFDQMSLGQEVNDAASSTHGAVTYVSENSEIIRVDNGTTLVAIAKGETKITATAAGDEEYEEKSIEKTIAVTENHVQYIVWTQSLMGLKLGGEDKTLNAYATSEEEEGVASERAITYTSDNTGVVTVDGNQLTIVGVGTANITAKQAGGKYAGIIYEAVEKVNKVVVKDPSAKCESFVYEQNGDPEEFFAFDLSTPEIKGTEHPLTGEPAKLTFNAKREYWKLVINYSKGNIVVDAYSASKGWQQVLDCGEPPIGSYTGYSVNLNRDVTKIRFRRPSGAQGYHYIADAKVEQVRYIETSTPSTTFQANVGEMQQQTILLNYSNLTGDIQLAMAGGENSHFSIDQTEIAGDCGDAKKNVALTITYTPTISTEDMTDGKESETLVITDGTTRCEVKLYGKATKIDRDIVWNINDENNVYTVEQIALTATAETKLHQPAGEVVYNIVGESTAGCGKIQNNVLSFAKNGTVYVEASTVESDQYNPADALTKTWVVAKTPTEVTSTPEIDGDIVCGNQLSDLTLKAATGAARNTVNQQPVKGTFAITAGDISTAGQHSITLTFTPENTDMYLPCTTDMTVTVQENMFTNASGDKRWDNPANWKAGVPTDETPDASVKGDLTISSDRIVNIFTIESGASVTIKNGATLTIKGSSAGRETYGDIIVENGGKLVIEETADSVCVQNVYLATSFGEHSSSQVIAADRLTVHGNAFFDITWADNANAQKWHAFTVPFPVDARKGIYDLDGNQLTNEVNYAIMSYHGDVRAQGKYGWAKFRNIMTPGTFYLMTVDGTIPTFRFRKTTEGNLAATNLLQVAQFPQSGDAQITDAGWNGIGNSQLCYVSVDAPVQVLNPVSYTYELMEASSTNFTVGTPFFYQATTDGTILLAEPNASAYYAPRRISESEIKNVDVTLSNATYTDHLYLSATDEATAEYQIGRDLVKMTMTATPSVPQIFALAYNASLCMVDAPLTNDEAQVSIRLYAPANGEYTLSVSNDAAADVYLLHNGMPVWNLSESAYILDLEKGNTEGYSLRLRRAHKQTTDMDAVNGSDKGGVQKVIMDNQLYILRAGSIYDAQGRLIDFQR